MNVVNDKCDGYFSFSFTGKAEEFKTSFCGIKKNLLRIQNQIKRGSCTRELINECVQKQLAKLSREFKSPTEITDKGANMRWQKLSYSLLYEQTPEKLHESGIHGFEHIYYATALVSILKSKKIQPYFKFEKNKNPREFTVISAVFGRLQSVLESYLKISALIIALKLLPAPEKRDFASLIEKLVHHDLSTEINKSKELLVPLGWMLPAPYGGHLILCKISFPYHSKKNLGDCRVQLFNPNPTNDSKLLQEYESQSKVFSVYELATSFTFTRKTEASTFLKDVYKILPLHIPQNLASRVQLPGQKKSIEKDIGKINNMATQATQTIYAVLGQNGVIQLNQSKSPLDYIRYTTGDNCVPSAFRMLLHTMVKEEADKAGMDLSFHDTLKVFCERVINIFMLHTASAFGIISQLPV